MSLIIWAASHEGLLVASDRQPLPNTFCVTHTSSILLAVSGDRPEWGFAAKLVAYLEKHEVDLASPLHVEALRTVLCQTLEKLGEGELTVSLGQHNHGLSGIVFLRVVSQGGRAQCGPTETREYTDDSETEFIPLGDEVKFFLSRVAQNPKFLKTLRQKKVKLIKDLTLATAAKIAREMIRDTRRAANKSLPECDLQAVFQGRPLDADHA